MAWMLQRGLAFLLIVAAAALGGSLFGALFDQALAGMWVAGLLAMALLLGRDAWQAQATMQWLRGPLDGLPPRNAGFWGELSYRVERALRQREREAQHQRDRLAQFLLAIEVSPNGVMMLDHSDQIEWCNSVAADHFGLDPQRDRRQRVTNLVRMPAFVAHLQSGRFDEAVVFSGPLGRITLSVLVRPYGGGQKLVLSQDVTQRERADAMRRDFVANVSHEIRTPLTVLAGAVDSLQHLPLNEAERQRVLGLMAQQTGRMQALVGDLLILARIEGSPRPPADRWLALHPLLLEASAEAHALSAGQHRIVLTGGEDTEITAVQPELLSAVTNLLNNAVRYTPAGGRIELAWSWRDDGGGELVVTDTGIGIAREHLPRLTERFYRVDGSRSRETGGTGLGLAIVKHVVQRHGGEIAIHSELGRGSSFKLVFPAFRLRRHQVVELPPAGRPALSA